MGRLKIVKEWKTESGLLARIVEVNPKNETPYNVGLIGLGEEFSYLLPAEYNDDNCVFLWEEITSLSHDQWWSWETKIEMIETHPEVVFKGALNDNSFLMDRCEEKAKSVFCREYSSVSINIYIGDDIRGEYIISDYNSFSMDDIEVTYKGVKLNMPISKKKNIDYKNCPF